MKQIRLVAVGMAAVVMAIIVVKLHGQSLDNQNLSSPAQTEPLVMNTSDMATVKTLSDAELTAFISALDATPQISYDALPDGAAGTFYSLQNPEWPPLPGDVNGLPVWPMNGFYLLNDATFNYSTAAKANTLSSGSSLMTMDSIDPTAPGDGGTNTYEPNITYMPPDYGTNLWLAQMAQTNGYLTSIASNTLAGVLYEVQTNGDISTTNWGTYIPYSFFYGSDETNWTSLDAILIDPTATNLFFRLKSWATDSSSIPIWWQLQYFGTNGIAPYGNPAGDGFDNYYKFTHGLNPNQFYTPAAPGGVSVDYYPASYQASVQWQPGAGAITGYQVEKTYEGHGGNFDVVYSTNDFNVSSNDFSLDDDVSTEASDDNFVYDAFNDFYKVRAQYFNGQYSDWSTKKPLKVSSLSASLVPGADGQTYLAVSGVPAGTVNIRLFYHDYDAIQHYYQPPFNFSNDIPFMSFTNGLYALPDSLQPPDYDPYGPVVGYQVSAQAVDANGNPLSAYSFFFYGISWKQPFYDGRVQLKQNLIFKLRAAGVDKPFKFHYLDPDNYSDYLMEFYDPPTNHVESSILHVTDALFTPGYSNPYDYYAWHVTLLDPQLPFFENYLYYNFVYSSANVDSSRLLNTGAGNYTADNVIYDLDLSSTPTWKFQAPSGAWTNMAGLLDAGSTGWICSIPLDNQNGYTYSLSSQYFENGITLTSTAESDNYALASGAVNLYGLTNSTEKLASESVFSGVLDINIANGSSYDYTDYYADGPVLYAGVAQPQLHTEEYDFWSPVPVWNETLSRFTEDWLPGSQHFSPTNQSQAFFVPVGSSVQMAGYAKMAVQNGYSGVYAYLGQYFDKSYKVDTNGVVTADPTGVLSPYGNFFATEAGRAALVTMPDVDTGQQGTNIVYCVALQVDKNHDGEMDSTFSGPDTTSQASPMVCWVNNGYILPGSNGSLDQDQPLPQNNPNYANCAQGKITCQRDLENFFRLWIRGLPVLAFSNGYSATLTCTAISGAPAINVYLAETNGGIGYLTDTNTAQSLVGESLMGAVGTTALGSGTLIFPNDFFDGKDKHLLFEGAGIGEGQFTLTIYQGTNAVCQTSTYLDLHDIKDLYEQAHINAVPASFPAMVNDTNASTFVSDHQLANNTAEDKQMVVLVHGWRMGVFDYQSFSDSMFRRFYWSGYHGRFASLRWPTLSQDDYWYLNDLLSKTTYNRSEYIAHRSADGTSAYFDWLKARLPDYSINAVSHSMGGIVMMETLKLQLAAGLHDIDNYVMMQAAVPAQCYDTSLADYPLFTAAESESPTPDVYRGFPGNIAAAVNGQIVNLYNANDYALATGTVGIPPLSANVSWEGNQVSYKPDQQWSYSSDGTNCFEFTGIGYRTVTDPREQMAFVARPRSKAVGAQSDVGGVVKETEQVDLFSIYHFYNAPQDHSAEFNWTIQQLGGPNGFYSILLNALFPTSP